MVRALLDGSKTQTRRAVKPVRGFEHNNVCRPDLMADSDKVWWHGDFERVGVSQVCPYGVVGDRLWVRESGLESSGRAKLFIHDATPGRWWTSEDGGRYGASYGPAITREVLLRSHRVRPSIHMPRWASRITLEITDVRVERLQEMASREERGEAIDAVAEGIECVPDELGPCYGLDGKMTNRTGYAAFARLWNSINEKRGFSWNANPWVWALTFKRWEAPHAGRE
jgi:hypothetical protein